MDNNELIRLNRALTEFYFSNVHNRLSEINTLLNLYKIRNISLVLILITFFNTYKTPLSISEFFAIKNALGAINHFARIRRDFA